MTEVKGCKSAEPLENVLRRFKRKVQQEDIIKEVKRHSYYLKPGEKSRCEGSFGVQTQIASKLTGSKTRPGVSINRLRNPQLGLFTEPFFPRESS